MWDAGDAQPEQRIGQRWGEPVPAGMSAAPARKAGLGVRIAAG